MAWQQPIVDMAYLAAIGFPAARHLGAKLRPATLAVANSAPVRLASPAAPVAPKAVKATPSIPAAPAAAPPAPAAAPAPMGNLNAISTAGEAAARGIPGEPTSAATKTKHVFLQDTFLYELADCEVLEAVIAEQPPPAGCPEGHVNLVVVLGQTLFHPKGGGQPADVGILSSEGKPELKVHLATLRKEDGAVIHECSVPKATADIWSASIGSRAVCRIDKAGRVLNARLHSAGHLLDAAVQEAGLNWIPGKGYHFPDGPYVEYVLNEKSTRFDPKKPTAKDAVVKQIQDNIDRLVAAGSPISTRYVDGMRRVAMAGEECGCGGTHVFDTSQIGKVEVRKVQNKQGNVRLAYAVAQAAEVCLPCFAGTE